MGLAASQARFLGITARKNSCELRSMQIAQEKLSITNQLTQISEDYQRSLDATKLVWDSEYITDGSVYDVTYELLMQPSLLNGYSPQLLTNNKNQIVLDSQFANAIKDVIAYQKFDTTGNPVESKSFAEMQLGGSTRNNMNFQNFLKALNTGGILSQNNLDKMLLALGDPSQPTNNYNPQNGLGGNITEKFTTNSMNLATMKSYINKITDPTSKYRNDVEERHARGDLNDDAYEQIKKLADILSFSGISYNIPKKDANGNIVKDSAGKPVPEQTTGTFGQFISNDMNIKNDTSVSDPKFNMADLLNKEVTLKSTNDAHMGEALTKFMQNIYGIMTDFLAINKNSVDMDYIDYAMDQVCKLAGMKWDRTNHQAIDFEPGKAYNTGDPASKHTCLIKNGDSYQISLSNLMKGTLTYFEKAVEGFESGYKVETTDEKKTENSFYITQDPGYYYFIKNPESLGMDNETQLMLDYYAQMFNQICANGWTESTLVSEPENLKNMLKNGTLFTSVLSSDGNFYQAPYTRNNFIAEVADQDAITRAEAEYKTKQLKLSAKEEELNIDMQMVDAELSALTTEYDTVKQMISKGVEKGFSTLGG